MNAMVVAGAVMDADQGITITRDLEGSQTPILVSQGLLCLHLQMRAECLALGRLTEVRILLSSLLIG